MNLEDDILIERFLKNELSEKEKQSFLDRLSSDASLREQVDLERQLMDSLNEKSWSFLEDTDHPEIREFEALLKSDEVKKSKQAIQDAGEAYKNKKKPTNNWFFYVAAAIAILIFSTLIFRPFEKSNSELFASYIEKNDLLGLVSRGNSDSIYAKAEASFENSEYQEVVNLLSPTLDTVKNSNVYLYLAISQMILENYSEAEKTLDKLISSDLLDSQKGYWYKGLLYLKSDQIEKSKKELQLIIDNSYYQEKNAKKLIKKLK
jgi:hypothetical protein